MDIDTFFRRKAIYPAALQVIPLTAGLIAVSIQSARKDSRCLALRVEAKLLVEPAQMRVYP